MAWINRHIVIYWIASNAYPAGSSSCTGQFEKLHSSITSQKRKEPVPSASTVVGALARTVVRMHATDTEGR